MMLDHQNLFSAQQSIADGTGTVKSTNIIDLLTPAVGGVDAAGNTLTRDVALDPDIEVCAQVTEDVTSAGAATVNFQLIGGTTLNAGQIDAPVVVAQTGALGKAVLVAGKVLPLKMPTSLQGYRYLGLQYVIAGEATDTGKVTAGLIPQGGRQTAPHTFVA